MSIKTLSLSAGAFALFATVAVAAVQPASAAGSTRTTPSVSQSTTDLSAARRHHQVQPRRSVRDAYGAYVGGPAAAPAQTWNSYGNGVGDNSRNQTW